MNEELLNKIITSSVAKTVSMYPNSKESMNEMKSMLSNHIKEETSELNDLKRTIRNFFLANIGLLVAAGVWIGTIQTRQDRNVEDIESIQNKHDKFDERISKNDITAAEIKAKLSGIEVTLLEIRQSLRIK